MLAEVRWYAGLVRRFFGMAWRELVSYHRWGFVLDVIRYLAGYWGHYIIIWATLRAFTAVAGWDANAVIFLFSLDLLTYALAQTILRGLWHLDELIVSGQLDMFLIRPVGPLVFMMARYASIDYVVHIALAGAGLAYALAHLAIVWTAGEWLLFLAALLGGTLIQGAIFLATASAAFWWTRADEFSRFMRLTVRRFIYYPVGIYPGVVALLLTIFPYAFINYYPALSLLRRPGITGAARALPLASLAVGALLIYAAYRVWEAGLRRYGGSSA